MHYPLPALGSDLMHAALEVYGVIKVAGKDKGVDDARRELASRFSRRSAAAAGTGSGGNN